jgi:hypothetical protein
MAPGPPGRRAAGTALRALIGVVVVLALGEAVVRRWIESPSTALGDPRYGFVQPPHTRIVHSSEGWSETRTNALGLFDDELQSHPGHRALLLGDSYAEALQVPRAASFQRVAERDAPGWEVVNAGMSGRSPVQYADWLDEWDKRLHPEIVLVQINDGDLDDLTLALRHPGASGMIEALGSGDEHGVRRLAHDVLRGSALATLVWRRVSLLSGYERERLAQRFTHVAATSAAIERHPPLDPRLAPMLDALYRRMAAHGHRVVFVYVPRIDYFAEPCAPVYAERRAFYHAFAERNHVELIDPTEAFCAEFRRTGQPVHGFANSVMGSGHINRRGHRLVGEAIAAALRESAP